MRIEFRFNGKRELRLYPESEYDSQLIDMAFRGTKVSEIRLPVKSGVEEVLVIATSTEKEEAGDAQTKGPSIPFTGIGSFGGKYVGAESADRKVGAAG